MITSRVCVCAVYVHAKLHTFPHTHTHTQRALGVWAAGAERQRCSGCDVYVQSVHKMDGPTTTCGTRLARESVRRTRTHTKWWFDKFNFTPDRCTSSEPANLPVTTRRMLRRRRRRRRRRRLWQWKSYHFYGIYAPTLARTHTHTEGYRKIDDDASALAGLNNKVALLMTAIL